MNSAFDTLFATSAAPALNTTFGETVIRWPQGYQGSAVNVTARWSPVEPNYQFNGDGESQTQEGTLEIAESVNPHREDVWVIGEEKYATVSIGAPEGSEVSVFVRSVNKILTKRHNSGEMY